MTAQDVSEVCCIYFRLLGELPYAGAFASIPHRLQHFSHVSGLFVSFPLQPSAPEACDAIGLGGSSQPTQCEAWCPDTYRGRSERQRELSKPFARDRLKRHRMLEPKAASYLMVFGSIAALYAIP